MNTELRIIISGIVLLSVSVAASCSGPQSTDESDEEVIGAPPSQDPDPYNIVTTPGEAEEAETSGYIGPDEETKKGKASKAKPSEEKKKANAPEKEEGVQCFSCVRICPLVSDGDASSRVDCGAAERDVICGWGVHTDERKARELARAECDGALDMARQMQTWSRIEGSCPAASCRDE